MAWERQKPIISKAPAEPSLVLWLITGIVALGAGGLLFVFHSNQLLGSFQTYSIWVLSSCPMIFWFVLTCLRGWLYNTAFNQHKFESDEAEYAQQQWSAWAGRHLAVLHSEVILPDSFTAAKLIQVSPELEQHCRQTRRMSFGEAEGWAILLSSVSDVLSQLPADLLLRTTILTDSSQDVPSLQAAFNDALLQQTSAERPAPYLNVLQSHSLLVLDERLRSSETSAELILVQQLRGGDAYSDALAVLLLTSDDVATKYELKHNVRLRRPMGLDKSRLSEELALFFSTQTQANSAQSIVGDQARWADDFVELLKSSEVTGGDWKTDRVYLLEKYAGLSGPFSPWIIAAVTSDMVRLQQADCLMLCTDGEQSFITSATTGKQNNDNG